MMAAPIPHVTIVATMDSLIRHRYAPVDQGVGAICRICGQPPSSAAAALWHDQETPTPCTTRWNTSEGALIWWHTSRGDQPIVMRLWWLH